MGKNKCRKLLKFNNLRHLAVRTRLELAKWVKRRSL